MVPEAARSKQNPTLRSELDIGGTVLHTATMDLTRTAYGTWNGGRFMHFGEALDEARYLAAIRVPLFVWSVEPPAEKSAAVSPALAAWGEVEDVSTVARLRAAVSRLRNELESQRIAWVEGTHLPQSIALAAGAEGVELP